MKPTVNLTLNFIFPYKTKSENGNELKHFRFTLVPSFHFTIEKNIQRIIKSFGVDFLIGNAILTVEKKHEA